MKAALSAKRHAWVWLAGLLLAGSACNVVHLRERTLRAQARRADIHETTLRLGRDRVHVWRGGSGTPVLLLHGFGASAIWQWHDQLAEFGRHHDVIAPDLLGFGGSWSTDADASLDHQTAIVVALLDRLELERVDVVGISYGGFVGYMLAGEHPDRVRRLVLVDSPGHAWRPADHDAMLARFGIASAAELFVPDSPSDIRKLLAIAWARPPRLPDWAARQTIATLYDPHRAAQIALLEHLERDAARLASELPRPRAPTLAVWGRDDPVFPTAIAERLCLELPARLVILEGARHLPNTEFPREFNDVVLGFLAEPP